MLKRRGYQYIKVLTVTSKFNAEEFLRLSQRALRTSLLGFEQQFVEEIRGIAQVASARIFEKLQNDIQMLDVHTDDMIRQVILDDLNQTSVNIRTVVYRKLRQQARPFTVVLHNLYI